MRCATGGLTAGCSTASALTSELQLAHCSYNEHVLHSSAQYNIARTNKEVRERDTNEQRDRRKEVVRDRQPAVRRRPTKGRVQQNSSALIPRSTTPTHQLNTAQHSAAHKPHHQPHTCGDEGDATVLSLLPGALSSTNWLLHTSSDLFAATVAHDTLHTTPSLQSSQRAYVLHDTNTPERADQPRQPTSNQHTLSPPYQSASCLLWCRQT